jgi:hypothetical protein
VAPQGQPQSDLFVRNLSDALQDGQATKDLEERTGLTREQLEQFATKFQKPKSGPAGPGREIDVTPREETPAKPAANLPGVDRSRSFSTKTMRERGFMAPDDVRDNAEGVRFEPPPELRAKWKDYREMLGRSKVTSARRTTRPK